MSEDGKTRPQPAMAPAPPPPPEVAAELARKTPGGFDPKGSRLLVESLIALGAILALGALVVFAGGTIASWAVPIVPLSVDEGIGSASAKQLELTTPECTNPAAQAYVENLARPLIEQAGKVPFEFSFRVADDPQVNAFALPGGYVTVNRGLLEAAESGEEVAGVLGHEIQHALLRHGTKRVLRQLGGAVILAMIFGNSDLHSLAQAGTQLTSLSYDRGQESEADARGVELLVGAGIDPRGLSTFFERLSKDSVHPPEVLSTHPDPGTRAELVKQAAKSGGPFGQLPVPSTVPCHLPGKGGEKGNEAKPAAEGWGP